MPYASLHPLAAAVGIVALATGCPPPAADLGNYTNPQTGDDPDSGEAGPTDAPITSSGGDESTGEAPPQGSTTDALDDTGALATTTTTTTAAADDSTTTGNTTDEVPPNCGAPDPFHPFPAPYVQLDGEITHGTCTLTALPPPPQPGQLAVRLLCPDEEDRPMIVNITILEGPLPDMTALIGQDIDVNINILPSELGPELHWVVFSRDHNLIYASVRGHTLLGDGVEGDAYAPFALDTALDDNCTPAPTTSDWPPADSQGFACELAAPLYLIVSVPQTPGIWLKAGYSLEVPVVGGKYNLEVRAVTRGHNCIPGFLPDTDLDTYSFAVALQPD